MATSVITNPIIGGGVNIKDLTEMERFLIGMLGRKYTYKDERSGASAIETILVPFSSNTVQTINVSLECEARHLQNMPELTIFGSTVRFPYNSYGPETHNLTPISSDIVVIIEFPVNWVINSFTTTDGKVHTASNLNY